ncbi:MAG: hypothetical protein Q9175_005217 [Cornicularia normoerica]
MLSEGVLQTIGAALLSSLPLSQEIVAAVYGAIGMGAVNQFRMMGGAIGLAIATSVFNGYLRSHLSATVSPQQMANTLPLAAEISKLDQDVQLTAREIFGQGYDLHMKILSGFGAAQIPASLLMWGTHGKASI